MATKKQLKARLNPAPIKVKFPTKGLFRPTGGFGGTVFKRDGDKISSFDVSALGKQVQPGVSGAGTQADLGLKELKKRFGFDIQSLPQVNMADLIQNFGKRGIWGQNPSGSIRPNISNIKDFNQFTGVAPASLQEKTLNTQRPPDLPAPQGGLSAKDQQATINAGIAGGLSREEATRIAMGGNAPITAKPDQTLIDFNNAIVNKDFGALQNMGVDTSNFDPTTGKTLTSTAITPRPKTNFQTTPPIIDVPVPPAPKPPAPISEVDKRLQAESDKALQANEGLTGRSAFQTQQEILAGVPEKQKLINDLSVRLQQLGNDSNIAQLKASDRLAPTTAITGEQQAIKRTQAIEALTINSQLSAAQGNLQNAIDMANRAVEAKFGPIEAKLETSLRNLDIIRNSPKYTASQKKKAEATAETKRTRLAEIALEKKDAQQVSEFTANVIANNPTIDAVTANALSKARNIVEASQIASARGLLGGEASGGKLLSVAEAKSLGVPFGTTESQAFGINPKKDPFQEGLPNTVIRQVDALSSKFDASPIVKQFNEVQNKSQSIKQIVDSGVSGAGDLALVFEFMKSLDPTSVVRESEYDVASNAGNPFKRIAAKMGGYVSKGQMLPKEVRDEFNRLSQLKLGVIEKQYDNLFNETGRKINMKTGRDDGSDYLTDYKGAFERPAPVSTPPELEDKVLEAEAQNLQFVETPKQEELSRGAKIKNFFSKLIGF